MLLHCKKIKPVPKTGIKFDTRLIIAPKRKKPIKMDLKYLEIWKQHKKMRT